MISLILVYTGLVVRLWKGILRRNILRKGKGLFEKGHLEKRQLRKGIVEGQFRKGIMEGQEGHRA